MKMHERLGKIAIREERSSQGGYSAIVAALSISLLLLAAPLAASAAEEETHLFNATLSLTGDCTVSALDPVEDPGCPGGNHPSSGRFVKPIAVAVDAHGNRYVGSWGNDTHGLNARIDIFGSSGQFLAEIPGPKAVENLAVDSQGFLYAATEVGLENEQPNAIYRYTPTLYHPAQEEIEYGNPPSVIREGGGWPAVAINPANDHLFVANLNWIEEFSSGLEGNELLGSVVQVGKEGVTEQVEALAIDAAHERLYISQRNPSRVVGAFELTPPASPDSHVGAVSLFTLDGSSTPSGAFTSNPGKLPLAVDEATGHLFVGDLQGARKAVYEFDQGGNPVSTIEYSLAASGTPPLLNQIAVDNGASSSTRGYLFVPSGVAPSHSYAFEPIPIPKPPVVEEVRVDGVTDEEAVIHAAINPSGLSATYRFEITSQQRFEAEGFAGASVAGEGTLNASSEAQTVGGPAVGLEPGTPYRVRVTVRSDQGEAEAEAAFTSYNRPVVSSSCPNQALRTGLSFLLPDCRAFELVTPADTNGHMPFGQENYGDKFPGGLASPGGDTVAFKVLGGLIPGIDGTASLFGDPFLSKRTTTGWSTEAAGPNGSVSTSIDMGSVSPDQVYSFWAASGQDNPAAVDGSYTSYVRGPDGHSTILGQGSIGTDPNAVGLLISEGGAHVIFGTGIRPGSPRQIEPNAAPTGTWAIYDRTPDGSVHVVSLLPGDVPLGPGQNALFAGASLDGRGVAFEVDKKLYLRHDNAATYEVADDVRFAGVAEGGRRVFYVEGGDLYSFDVSLGVPVRFTESGDATVVNISADGSSAYFVSAQALPVDPNPSGNLPQPGGQNLYLSRDGQISFVGSVTARDVQGEKVANDWIRGLGLWMEGQGSVGSNVLWGSYAIDPSRSTDDGNVLLFESNAPLGGFDPEGHTQIYRYDAAEKTLKCLSCNATLPASGDARLQTLNIPEHLTHYNPINNLSVNGSRAFFESTEALVLGDVDEARDVYEWEEDGVGSCEIPGGCIYLISSGASAQDDYLYAVSDSGDDVFVKTSDLLLPAIDGDETPSIYDARIGGGFPDPQGPVGECLGEACQPAVSAPSDPTPASAAYKGAGNVAEPKRSCPRAKREVRKGSAQRCVPKHKRKHKQHHKTKRSGAKGRSHR